MKGLIIKPHWADLILSGTKTWEIRGKRTEVRGTIGIIKSKSGMIYGTAEIVDCISLHGPNDIDMIMENQLKHHVPLGSIQYLKPWAWVLENAKKFPEPVPYKHPQGAVIWVNLPNTAIEV